MRTELLDVQVIPERNPIDPISEVAEILIEELDATVELDVEITIGTPTDPTFCTEYTSFGIPRDVPAFCPEISSQYGFNDTGVENDTPPDPFACKICPLVADPELIFEELTAPDASAAEPTDPAAIFAATTALSASAADPTAPAFIFAATTALSAILAEVTAPSTICEELTELSSVVLPILI